MNDMWAKQGFGENLWAYDLTDYGSVAAFFHIIIPIIEDVDAYGGGGGGIVCVRVCVWM